MLTVEPYYLVKPLIGEFLVIITCSVKIRSVLKKRNSDLLTWYFNKIPIQNYKVTRYEYGVQIHNNFVNFSHTTKNNASKKQVAFTVLNNMHLGKPFLIKNYAISNSFGLLKLRITGNGIFPACVLADSIVNFKTLARKFSTEIEPDSLKLSILNGLNSGKWPTDCIKKRKFIKNYVQSVQNQILFYDREQQLNFITKHVFDI